MACWNKKKDTGIHEPLLEGQSETQCSLAKVNIKNTEAIKQDPLLQLGYGIVAYRNILWTMIVAFSVFTILSIPSLVIYGQGQAYKFGIAELQGKEHLSLGNLGYSSMQCS